MPSSRPGRRRTTASPMSSPFFVPPNETASTPASVVIDRSETPRPAAAFARRAPSTCSSRPRSWAKAASSRELAGAVAGPELGALADAHDARLHRVLVADPPELRRDELGRELAVGRRHRLELAAGDPLRRAALVDVDVRPGGADDRLPGPAQRPQAQDVRRAAVEDEVGARLLAEVLAQQLERARRPRIGAVGDRVVLVGRGDRGEHLGVRAGVVVGGEGPHAPSLD